MDLITYFMMDIFTRCVLFVTFQKVFKVTTWVLGKIGSFKLHPSQYTFWNLNSQTPRPHTFYHYIPIYWPKRHAGLMFSFWWLIIGVQWLTHGGLWNLDRLLFSLCVILKYVLVQFYPAPQISSTCSVPESFLKSATIIFWNHCILTYLPEGAYSFLGLRLIINTSRSSSSLMIYISKVPLAATDYYLHIWTILCRKNPKKLMALIGHRSCL